MYPQSLHTHSPSQYNAAFSASIAFCALDFLAPKTFKLVLDVCVATESANADVDGAVADGRRTKADVVENDKHTKASSREIMEVKDFMVAKYGLSM